MTAFSNMVYSVK